MRHLARFAKRSRDAILLVSLLIFLTHSSLAATYSVTNTADSGAGSLRQAVNDSNAAGGTNSISWAAGGAGTLSLLSNLAGINASTTLDATNACNVLPTTLAGAYSVPLSGAVTFSNSGANAWTISATISGSGTLVKAGTGVVALTGTNSYTGGTYIQAGTLSVNSDDALGDESGGIIFQGGSLLTATGIDSSRDVSLSGNGTINTGGNNSAISGAISGSGALVKTGAGLLSLRETNSYSGGTLLNGGTLGIADPSALGTGGLTFNGGALQTQVSLSDSHNISLDVGGGTFDTAGTTSTISGLISGIGGLTKTSSGTLVISGANTYSGGTTVSGGVLRVSSEQNLGDLSGSITLNGGGVLQTAADLSDARSVSLGIGSGVIDTYGYNPSGIFSGAGGLTKIGSGVLTLSGANTYAGGTTVSEGTLRLGTDDGMPANGALSVGGGAAFDMYGHDQTTSLGAVINNGLFNVGSGQVTMNSGYSGSGTLAMKLQGGVTNVTGQNINLAGTTLSLGLAAGSLPMDGQVYTPISDTAGGLTGTLAGITSPAALSFTPAYTAGGVTLTTRFIPLADIAVTRNQAAVGAALEPLRTNPTGDAATVIESLYKLNAADLQSALDQIGPIPLASAGGLGLSVAQAHTSAVAHRMTILADGPTRGNVDPLGGDDPWFDDEAPAQSSKGPDESDTPWGAFASAIAEKGRSSGGSGDAGSQPGYNFNVLGMHIGGDHRFSENLAAGVSGAYLRGHAELSSDGGGTVDEDSGRLGVYAVTSADDRRAHAYVGGAVDAFSTHRGISFGSISRSAEASPWGHELNMSLNGSFDIRSTNAGIFSPFAGLDFDRLGIGAFKESGAGSLDLSADPDTLQSLRSRLGMRFSQKARLGHGAYGIHFEAGWLHEFADTSHAIAARLASGAGGSFTVATPAMGREGAMFGGGIAVAVSRMIAVNLDYRGELRSHYTANSFNAGLHLKF